MKEKFLKYQLFKYLIKTSSYLTTIFLVLILLSIFIPAINSIFKYFTNQYDFNPLASIVPTLISTLILIVISIFISSFIGIGTAIYLNEYSKNKKIKKVLKYVIENLAGIPSIIYGLFGSVFFVVTLKLGYSIISGALIMSIMLLPTIIISTEESLKNVPRALREASIGLGAHKFQTIFKIIIPSAMAGIINGIILNIGKVIGETAALMLTMGTVLQIPSSIFDSARTISLQIFKISSADVSLERMYAEMFIVSLFLIILVFIINIISNFIEKKYSL